MLGHRYFQGHSASGHAFSRVSSVAKRGRKSISNYIHVILKQSFKVPLSLNKTWKNHILAIRKAEIHFIIIEKKNDI